MVVPEDTRVGQRVWCPSTGWPWGTCWHWGDVDPSFIIVLPRGDLIIMTAGATAPRDGAGRGQGRTSGLTAPGWGEGDAERECEGSCPSCPHLPGAHPSQERGHCNRALEARGWAWCPPCEGPPVCGSCVPDSALYCVTYEKKRFPPHPRSVGGQAGQPLSSTPPPPCRHRPAVLLLPGRGQQPGLPARAELQPL